VQLRRQGAAVFLNSHLLSEVEVTCDRVAFVKRGRVVREMSLAGHDDAAIEVELKLGQTPPELLGGLEQFGCDVRRVGETIRLQVTSEDCLPTITRWLVDQGVDVYRVGAQRPSLEALFLETMGDEERPG
jgi:ABC-2 type transport system ATP-binding protein